MIILKEPKGNRKEAVPLSSFFSNESNTVYPIQSDLQRRYCWPSTYVDKLFKDYIIDLFDKNKEADENGEDGRYGIIGDGILTREEDNYGPDGKCTKQEIIDMSQRMTTVMSFIVVMLYIYVNNNKIEDISERERIFAEYLKTKNGLSWKVISTFKDSDFEEVVNSCINNTLNFDEKNRNSLTACFKESNKKKNEVKYKSFKSLCAYVYSLIDSTIGTNNDSIKDRLDKFLAKTYIQVEECEKKDRVVKFKEVNTFRLGIANADIFKSLLCDKKPRVDEKFQEFEEHAKAITEPKRINILKSPITETEYILKLGLIVMDKTRNTCKTSFSLDDEKNGIVYQLNSGFLNTEDNVLKYLDICIDICRFLEKSMEYNPEGFNEEWYLLTENHKTPFIWLYNILPCYVIHKLNDIEKKNIAFEMLLKSYTAYSLKYAISRSVQYIQTYMYSFAKEILENGDDSCCIEDFKSVLEELYNSTFHEFIASDLTKTIKKLDWSQAACKTGIYSVLSCIEYLAQKQCGEKKKNLYNLIKKGEIEIDHIFPQRNRDESNEDFIDSIGNLTFLEKSLNASKQDDECLTSERYADSSFISTKLMIKNNRYENLTNRELEILRQNIIPYCTDKDTINNFRDEIDVRRNSIAMKIKEFLI